MITLKSVRARAESDARSQGYYLNPDSDFLKDVLEGLRQNEERYGYPACPCRLATGVFELDRDIICPCDYRGIDCEEYGRCYCALYVRKDVYEGKTKIGPIPERRSKEKQKKAYGTGQQLGEDIKQKEGADTTLQNLTFERRMWYCKQCGYVCFREEAPYICPICKAKREMFADIKVDLRSG